MKPSNIGITFEVTFERVFVQELKEFNTPKIDIVINTFNETEMNITNCGLSWQQNVMPSAPGQGYLECIVYNEGEIDLTGLEEGTTNKTNFDNTCYYLSCFFNWNLCL